MRCPKGIILPAIERPVTNTSMKIPIRRTSCTLAANSSLCATQYTTPMKPMVKSRSPAYVFT